MPKLKITGASPYDGEYEFPEKFKTGELHRINQICGVAGGEIKQELERGNVGLTVALVVVVLERTGLTVDQKVLWDADSDAFDVVEDKVAEVADDRPPVSPTANGAASSTGAVEDRDVSTITSGSDSDESSEESPSHLRSIGALG